jgi:isorenieratene synthase
VSEGDELVIGGGTSVSTEVLPTDYVVVACEVRGLKELLRRSDWCGQPELERRVGAMGEADPYIVYRLWLDRPVRPDRTEFVSCSGFRYLDSIAVYSHFQEESIAWARRTGGSIVELHAYGVPPELLRPATEMARALFEEMQRCLPELEGARILHEEYQQQSNFSRFAPGDRALRPATETPLSNLLLAGDHIRLEPACALMEAAAMSGRFAANAIFRQEGLREQPVRTVPLKGVLA